MTVPVKPMDRVDGRQKVTGAAKFAAEYAVPNPAYAVLVTSTIPKGRILEIDTAAAGKSAGVLAVLTHENTPKMKPPAVFGSSKTKPAAGATSVNILQTDQIYWHGQRVAVVVAGTFEQARHASYLVRVKYEEQPANLTLESKGRVFTPKKIMEDETEIRIGDAEGALKKAVAVVDQTYRTPQHNHNPIEPHATVAAWEGEDKLTVYDATQFVFGIQYHLATQFALKPENVRVLAPFVGGGFGGKGSAWPHVSLAAAAARGVGRPVKLVVSREQMYAIVGGRTPTKQRVALAADADGKLSALIHTGLTATSTSNLMTEQFTFPARHLYGSPNIYLTQQLIELDACPPTFMRAPGETPSTFALESAMDELAHALKIDPVELRLRNDPEKDPTAGTPFSNRKFKEAFRLGAEKFGWAKRKSEPRSMRDGRHLVGMGVATAFYPVYRFPASASTQVFADGTALVQSGCQEMGMGTATAQTQVAAEALGLPPENVKFELGDTNLPMAFVAGGSSQTISVGSAVVAACGAVKKELLALAAVKGSPLNGAKEDAVIFREGGLFLKDNPAAGETFAAILNRAGKKSVTGKAGAMPMGEDKKLSMQSYGAQFCEVRVDPDLGEIRVSRFVGAFDVGRVINAKTARSQFIGGITMGIGMALMEATHPDRRNGRITNANLADYLIPTHADIPALEAYWVGEADPHTPMGAHGIGEIGITGVAAAIANAVFHATGKRIRETPITPDKIWFIRDVRTRGVDEKEEHAVS